jgi:methylmalonyl-CoA mutase C-terminal domain/subunit
VPKLMNALREADMADVPVVVGGIVPDDEVAMLEEAGVARVFRPGASRDEIVRAFRDLIAGRRAPAMEGGH